VSTQGGIVCQHVEFRYNVIAIGNSDAGKTHVALGLGLAACQWVLPVGFITAALVYELMEARDERRMLNLQRQLSRLDRPTHHVHILEMNGKSYRVNRNTDNTALRLKPNRTPPKVPLLIPLSG
jgi:DNA replication protein DnaC